MIDKHVLFSDSFSARSLEPTDAGTCTISDYKIEVLELLPDGKFCKYGWALV